MGIKTEPNPKEWKWNNNNSLMDGVGEPRERNNSVKSLSKYRTIKWANHLKITRNTEKMGVEDGDRDGLKGELFYLLIIFLLPAFDYKGSFVHIQFWLSFPLQLLRCSMECGTRVCLSVYSLISTRIVSICSRFFLTWRNFLMMYLCLTRIHNNIKNVNAHTFTYITTHLYIWQVWVWVWVMLKMRKIYSND